VTQIAPALCDRLGDGDGLADLVCDQVGDGLGERDLDGLGLLEADGVGLLVWLGLDEPLGLRDALGLELPVGLVLADAAGIASSLADTAATELCPHGEPIGRADEAKAGAIAKPDARKDPATRLTAIRPTRSIATGTVALLSWGQP